jgi:hypothetical protein
MVSTADYRPAHHDIHVTSDLTWRIAWHSGFGGTHTVETRNPEMVVWAVRKHGADWVEVFGATNKNRIPVWL